MHCLRLRAATLSRSVPSTRSNSGKLSASALILLLSLHSSLASATEPPATPVVAGEPAPFSGQLLSTERAIKLGQRADRCDAQIKIELDRALQQSAWALAHERRSTEIEHERAEAFREVAEHTAGEADNWSRSPALAAAVTVVVTLGLVLVTGYAMREVGR